MSLPRKKPWDRTAAAKRYADKRRAEALESGTYNSLDASREKAFASGKRSGKSYARINARNTKRRREERERAFGPKERRAFVKTLPCSIPGCPHTDIQNAHVGSHVEAGMGRRGDANTIAPLCAGHHRQQEGRTAAFERDMGLPEGFLMDCAARTEAAWTTQHHA